jgi:hypothetical protein
MKIRRFQYNIDYVHIITFNEEFKWAVAPYFGFDQVEYVIENPNTLDANIRLIFKVEKLFLFIRKEGLTVVYEGEIDALKEQNGVIKIFWDIFEKIKSFKGYTKSARHSSIIFSVDVKNKEEIETILIKSPYQTINPFGKLDEFACVYEFQKNDKTYKFEFGNYSEKDIKKYDLSPFKTEFNKDLIGAVGLMSRFEVYENQRSPDFTKFKSLLTHSEAMLSTFQNVLDETKF